MISPQRPPSPQMSRRGTSMGSVPAADGTRLAYQRSGAGPPLVLVHGTADDHTCTGYLSYPSIETSTLTHRVPRIQAG